MQAVPRSICHELRRRHFDSVREALEEARFLQSVEEDEVCDNDKVFTVEAENKQAVEEPQVDLNQIVEACVKQMQALQTNEGQSKRPRSARRKLRCWCCGEEGHTLKECPVIQQNKAAYFKQPAEVQAEN